MIKRDCGQMSFYSHVYDSVIPREHFLRRLCEAVDFGFVNAVCESLYCTDNGRPGYDLLFMFKITFLQFLYGLSDRDVMKELQVNLAYKWFVGLDVIDCAPSATSLTKFRSRLGADKFKELFNCIVKAARDSGLIADRLQIIDSTHIEARVDLFRLKDEHKINDDDNNYVDRNSPDRDARFGRKGGRHKKTFFGYKEYMSIDADSELFTAVEASAGNEYDGHFLLPLVSGSPDALTADKAYDNEEYHKGLKRLGISDVVIRKDKNGIGLAINIAYGHEQRERPKIERRFADQKKNHGLGKCRYFGLWRTQIQCCMTALVCNCKRIVTLLINGVQTQKAAAA